MEAIWTWSFHLIYLIVFCLQCLQLQALREDLVCGRSGKLGQTGICGPGLTLMLRLIGPAAAGGEFVLLAAVSLSPPALVLHGCFFRPAAWKLHFLHVDFYSTLLDCLKHRDVIFQHSGESVSESCTELMLSWFDLVCNDLVFMCRINFSLESD